MFAITKVKQHSCVIFLLILFYQVLFQSGFLHRQHFCNHIPYPTSFYPYNFFNQVWQRIGVLKHKWDYRNSVKSDDEVEERATVNIPGWLIKLAVIRFHEIHKEDFWVPATGKTCRYSQPTTKYRSVPSHILLVFTTLLDLPQFTKKLEVAYLIGKSGNIQLCWDSAVSLFPHCNATPAAEGRLSDTSSFTSLSHMVWHWS